MDLEVYGTFFYTTKKNMKFTLTDKNAKVYYKFRSSLDIVLKCEKTMIGGEIFINKNLNQNNTFLKVLDPKEK